MRYYLSMGMIIFLGLVMLPELKAQQLDVIDIESVFNETIPLTLSEIATGVDYIPLEINNNCVLGDIYDVRISGDNMALISQKQVYLFDIQGKFQRKIGQIGKGPGEYQWAKDIQFSPDGNSVFVVDITGFQIIEYDLNGKHLKSISLPVRQYPEDMLFFDDHFYIMHGMQGLGLPFLYKMDNQGLLLQDMNVTCEAYQSSLRGYQESCSFLVQKDHFDLATAWNDTIFRIYKSGKKEAIFWINYGKIKYTLKGASKNQPMKEGLAFQLWRAITQNYIFIHSQDGRDLKLVVYDRKSNAIIHSSNIRDDEYGGIKNDLDGGPGIDLIVPFQKNNGKDVIQCHSAISLIEHMNKDNSNLKPRLKKENEKLRKLVDQLSEEDNPVVQIFHLK